MTIVASGNTAHLLRRVPWPGGSVRQTAFQMTTLRRILIVAAGVLTWIALGVSHSLIAACAGDINMDGTVNVLDLDMMNAEVGRIDCFTLPCLSDLNNDGEVNSSDKEMLQAELGRIDCFSERMDFREHSGGTLRSVLDEAAVQGEINYPAASGSALYLQEDGRVSATTTPFKDNGDGTVSDAATGLMWTRDANLPRRTMLFHQALSFLEEMNKGNPANYGHTDWRLPNLEELTGLIDYTRYTGKGHDLPQGHPFENVQSLQLHSPLSPTYLWGTELSWCVSLYCRIVGHNAGSCFGYLWPVRGGR